MATTVTVEVAWKICDNILKLYEDVYAHNDDLWIKLKNVSDDDMADDDMADDDNNNDDNNNTFNVCQVISIASQSLFKQLQNNDYNTDNNIKCAKFIHWLCALSMSFTNPPINILKKTLIPNQSIIHNVLDIIFIDILRKTLVFVSKQNRSKCINHATDTNHNSAKQWLFEIIATVSYHKHRLLTPQFVKQLSKTLILMINIIICETTAKHNSHTIRNYFTSSQSFISILFYTLLQLLGTYVLPESIHCKSLELPFHSKMHKKTQHNHNNNTSDDSETNSDDNMPQPSHNDMKQYISANRWRMAKSAQLTIQFHRLLIKCIFIIINDILSSPDGTKMYDMILKHPSQRVIMLQLMHFSVVRFDCALNLLQWICHKTYVYKTENKHKFLYNLVYNLGLSFISLCDEYQLEGNEFEVNMFYATSTTEDDEDIHSTDNKHLNDAIIPHSAQKNKYLTECGKKYMAYFANVFRFANCIDSLYTFHVKKAVLIILPLLSLCVKVRNQIMRRKEVIEFLKELFYVTLPPCSYLFIRWQYEAQYSIDDIVPILLKSRCGFNRENILTFYENEALLQANCITALHIFLYLGDIDGISCKTIIKNLDRTSKREWRNYIQHMFDFTDRFPGLMAPIYNEFDFAARLKAYIEYSKPKKIFSHKRHPNINVKNEYNNDIVVPVFHEYIENGWICEHNIDAVKAPAAKKRKLNNNEAVDCEQWPINNIRIRLRRIMRGNGNKKKKRRLSMLPKQQRQSYGYEISEVQHYKMYPDMYYSPCLQEIKLLSKWEPVIIKHKNKNSGKEVMDMDDGDSDSDSDIDSNGSFIHSTASEDEYKPPVNAEKCSKTRGHKKRRSKRLNPLKYTNDEEEGGGNKKNSRKRRRSKSKKKKKYNVTTFRMLSEELIIPRTAKISRNAANDLRLYDELKNRNKLELQKIKNKNLVLNHTKNNKVIQQLLSPPSTVKHPMMTLKTASYQAIKVQLPPQPTQNVMNLPDINKSFQPTNNNNFNYHNNYNNNINININNHHHATKKKKCKKKKKGKIVDLSKSSDEDLNINDSNVNMNMLTKLLSNTMNPDVSMRGLQEMLLRNNNESGQGFNNENMFKIDPSINTEQMSNHLYSCFEQQSICNINSINNDVNKASARILLIAEHINDNIIRIECDDEVVANVNKNGLSHLEESINSGVNAVISTNNKYLNNNNHKKILFTAQMRAKKKIDLILDCFYEKSNIFSFMRRCNSSQNQILVNSLDTNNCSVHNLAKNIIASLNEHKYIILIPKNNNIKSINIIIESMIVAHTAIKTQFKQVTNYESFWLYCLIETNQNLPILGQVNNNICSNWLFKIVMNNNY